MSACCHIQRVETACPQPPVQDPGGGAVTTPVLIDQGLWFECFYSDCHPGVGFVRLYNSAGSLLYAGCPRGRPKTYVAFNAALLDYGSYVHVDYTRTAGGLASPCYGGHGCNRAKFNVGLGGQQIGIADLDNGGGGDRFNRLSISNSIIDAYLAGLNPGTGPGPQTPGGLQATYMTQQKIVLIWNDLSTSETGYEIERKTPSVDWQLLATTPANTSIYKDEAPPDGAAFGYNIKYSYRVRATGSAISPWTDIAEVTTPASPDASRRQVCYVEVDTCNLWTEFVPNPAAAVNYIPVGTKFAALPAGKSIRIASVNYASRGNIGSSCPTPPCPSTSQGALLEVRSPSGSILATLPLNLTSTGAQISPFPFDGRSIDSNPFVIQNSWGVAVDIFAAGGLPGFPGIYFDDSAAYQIV
jgi:hypothetical protein